jgi:hypothetical protein
MFRRLAMISSASGSSRFLDAQRLPGQFLRDGHCENGPWHK